MKEKEVNLQETILKIAEVFEADRKIVEKKHCDFLIKILSHFKGTDKTIADLKEKGLPKMIIIADDISIEIESALKYCCPIHRNPLLSKGQIVFSWIENTGNLIQIEPPKF